MEEESLLGDFGGFGDEGEGDAWLFRHDGRLYGPLSTEPRIERVKTGLVPSATTVARDRSHDFRPLEEITELKAEIEKALAHFAAQQKREAAQRRKAASRNVA